MSVVHKCDRCNIIRNYSFNNFSKVIIEGAFFTRELELCNKCLFELNVFLRKTEDNKDEIKINEETTSGT